MPNAISFVDLLVYIKKHLKSIVALALAGMLAGLFGARSAQEYTATVGIKFTHSSAAEGLNPLGGALDPYEIMAPSLIAITLQDMQSDLSVDEVRNKLSITPVISSKTKEAESALLALGEVMEIHTTEYNVSYTCPGYLGSHFAQRLLYSLLQAYDTYFSKQYLQRQRISDFMAAADIENMDYMEKCEYINAQLTAINTTLNSFAEAHPEFISKTTSLDFAALRSYYYNLRKNQYDRLYANVRMGLLTNNKDLLLKGYKRKMDEMRLEENNKQAEADQARKMVEMFYEQYKKTNLYYQAQDTQEAQANGAANNRNLVYDLDFELTKNTYDDLLLRYLDTSVSASILKHERAHYQDLIDAFDADQISPGVKAKLLDASNMLLEQIADKSTQYAALANKTFDDYFEALTAQNLKYVMAVEVTSGVSTIMFIIVGGGVAGIMSAAFAIVFEILRTQLKRRGFGTRYTDTPGVISEEMIDEMSAIERAFYEQSQSGFSEFYLMYQTIVNRDLKWEMAETLVRWKNKRLGQIFPDEFLPIAEKYGLMDKLGEWIMQKACEQSLEWSKSGDFSPYISVNYSTHQIESQSFIDSILRILSETKVDAHHICLEISRGGELKNITQVAQKFKALKAFGLKLAIDRFGDTLSSMRVLYDLPADMVKVDRRCIDDLMKTEEQGFLYDVIKVCKEQNLAICACGVEESWQVDKLRELGIEYMQGFYFSSPLDLPTYERRMAENLHQSIVIDIPAEANEPDLTVNAEEENGTAEWMEGDAPPLDGLSADYDMPLEEQTHDDE